MKSKMENRIIKLMGRVWMGSGAAVTLIFILVLVWVIIMLPVSLQTEALCLRYGWKDSAITWNLKRYCIREENEYEIVCPLEDVVQDNCR